MAKRSPKKRRSGAEKHLAYTVLELKRAFLLGKEDDALSVLHALQRRFGWAGTMFTRADAESQIEDVDDAGEVVERKFTDEEWTRVRATAAWDSVLGEILTERGWDIIRMAIRDAEVVGAAA